jgi:hypothetical protein
MVIPLGARSGWIRKAALCWDWGIELRSDLHPGEASHALLKADVCLCQRDLFGCACHLYTRGGKAGAEGRRILQKIFVRDEALFDHFYGVHDR